MEGTKIPEKMLSQDPYSQWLGIAILECELGRCKVGMTVRKEMLNSINEGDYLVAESVIEKVNTKLGFNIIEVRRKSKVESQKDELVALFKGVVYRTNKDW